MEIQEFEWGTVKWIQGLHNNINVGISKIFPNTFQKPHVHFENEQIIYVLSGRGEYQVNNEFHLLNQGDHLYFPYNSIHSTKNLEPQDLVDLVVSIPRGFNRISESNSNIQSQLDSNDSILTKAINHILIDLNDATNFDFSIINEQNKIKFCSNDSFTIQNFSSLFNILDKVRLAPPTVKISHNDLEIFPMYVQDVYIGAVVFNGSILKNDQISNTSKNSIQNYFHSLVESIESFAYYLKLNLELKKNTSKIINHEQKIRDMQEALNIEKEKSISVKINQHFMYNTLNYMASLALEEENTILYDLIVLFADMVRYTSDNSATLVSIRQELEYLNTYIKLQKYRYPDFVYEESVDSNLIEYSVPINSLQPIVENAFSHGFLRYNGKKYIKINIREIDPENLEIKIINNGSIIDMNSLKNINASFTSISDNGLSLIYRKFYTHFKNEFFMELESNFENTQMIIQFPKLVSKKW